MPRAKRKLTWHQPSQSWRKRKTIDGKVTDFYFKYPKNQTGYRAALAEWEQKESEIESSKTALKAGRELGAMALFPIRERMEVAEYYRLEGQEDHPVRQRMLEESDIFQKAIMSGSVQKAFEILQKHGNISPIPSLEKEEGDIDTKRMIVQKHQEWSQPTPPPVEKDLSHIVQSYCEIRKKDRISLKQWNAITNQLRHFVEWAHDRGVAEIDSLISKTLGDYRAHLLDMVDEEKIAQSTAKRRFSTLLSFLNWAFENEYIEELPKNFRSKSLQISKADTKPNPFEIEEVQRVLEAAAKSNQKTELFILLALNCGMLPSDIGDLREEEVDWQEGSITRQRTKTRRYGKNIPTITYPLWPKTFALLKKFRSDAGTSYVLTDQDGEKLVEVTDKEGKVKEKNMVLNAFRYLVRHKLDFPLPRGKTFKTLRTTGASVLESHETYGRFSHLYLGHAPYSIKDQHYAAVPQAMFKAAILWLGEKMAIGSV